MVFTIRPGITPCLRCLFPNPPAPGTTETCDTAGVIGPIIHIVAAHQAVEALKLLVRDEQALDTRLRHFECWYNHDTAMEVSQNRKPDCPTCGQGIWEFLDPADKEPQAVSLCGRDTVQISPSAPQPMDLEQLAKRLAPLGRVEKIAFFCGQILILTDWSFSRTDAFWSKERKIRRWHALSWPNISGRNRD